MNGLCLSTRAGVVTQSEIRAMSIACERISGADVSRLPGADSKARALYLLETTGVATVPGKTFFANPDDRAALTRFCFAKSDADLDKACRRLGQLG